MARIGSLAALLHAALQDIHAGLIDQTARIPMDAAQDAALREVLAAERGGSAGRAVRLVAIGLDPAGPRCLWMAGVLDDAARDDDSTQPGRLLDVALAGAIRKGKAAEAVACDTALALAAALDDTAAHAVVAGIKADALAADAALLAVIVRLAGAD